jgi:phosphoribosylaminoimidazole-succinocarboxamide synthase
MKLWKVGKVKKVYKVSHQKLQFEFTDQMSVFNKVILSSIKRTLNFETHEIRALRISEGDFYDFEKL